MTRIGILVTGVGGQGVLTAARVIGDAAHRAEIAVVVGQLHGLTQRGGAVSATVVLGGARGAILPEGGADVVLALDPVEAARAIRWIGSQTLVVASTAAVALPGGRLPDPADVVLADVRDRAARLVTVDALALAERTGSRRCLNMVMVGALAGTGRLPLDPEITATVVAEIDAQSLAAYRLGRQAAAAYLFVAERAC